MKALRTAAVVVGAVALVATGVGAALGAAAATTVIGAGVTVSSLASAASVAAGVLSIATTALTPKPKGSLGGSAQKFTIDKESGIPVVIGRTMSGGKVVHRAYYGAKNIYESWVAVHSIGPVKSLGPLQVDKVPVTFGGGAAVGSFAGFMWLASQLGACPEAAAMTGPVGAIPDWSATSKLSGLAADLWTLKYDAKGKVYPNGVPQRGRVVEGVYCYDPRKDGTFPGGVGTCRIDNPATWVWDENPALNALTWAHGYVQNGALMAGGGLPVAGIDVRAFAEWANVCEANGWKAGGVVYTDADNGFDVLKMLCQAGGAEPITIGGILSVSWSAPKVSLATITSADVMGEIDVPATASMRARRNTIIPKVRLETHGWEVVPIDPVSVPAFVTIDGAKRPKEIAYPLVQGANQAAQLAMYDLLNMRERDGIVLPLKIYALGYLPGDCVTLDIPEANLNGVPVTIRNRQLSAGSFGVTLTCREESAGKHAQALAAAGSPPPVPDLSVPVNYNTAASEALISLSLGGGGSSNEYTAADIDQIKQRMANAGIP